MNIRLWCDTICMCDNFVFTRVMCWSAVVKTGLFLHLLMLNHWYGRHRPLKTVLPYQSRYYSMTCNIIADNRVMWLEHLQYPEMPMRISEDSEARSKTIVRRNDIYVPYYRCNITRLPTWWDVTLHYQIDDGHGIPSRFPLCYTWRPSTS